LEKRSVSNSVLEPPTASDVGHQARLGNRTLQHDIGENREVVEESVGDGKSVDRVDLVAIGAHLQFGCQVAVKSKTAGKARAEADLIPDFVARRERADMIEAPVLRNRRAGIHAKIWTAFSGDKNRRLRPARRRHQ
jgi:hypothetical protein